LLYC